jgi:hypothetical protein
MNYDRSYIKLMRIVYVFKSQHTTVFCRIELWLLSEDDVPRNIGPAVSDAHTPIQ